MLSRFKDENMEQPAGEDSESEPHKQCDWDASAQERVLSSSGPAVPQGRTSRCAGLSHLCYLQGWLQDMEILAWAELPWEDLCGD